MCHFALDDGQGSYGMLQRSLWLLLVVSCQLTLYFQSYCLQVNLGKQVVVIRHQEENYVPQEVAMHGAVENETAPS